MTADRMLSIIVCTGDRPDQLGRVLEALTSQTVPRDAFEVIVVDGGGGRALEHAGEFEAQLHLRLAREPGAGSAVARNRGVAMATGEILVFLGDSVIADRRFLEAHREAHLRRPDAAMAVRGTVRLAPPLAVGPLGRVLAQLDGTPFRRLGRPAGDRLAFSEFRTDASSCKRSHLLAHGLFDPEFRSGCEDVELAWRLSRSGFEIVHEPGAVGVVERLPGFDDLCREFREDGAARFLLSRKHPEEAVVRFAQVAEAARAWQALGPVAEALARSAREVDRVVGLRRDSGLVVTRVEAMLLERGYWTAFRTSRYAGMAEQAAAMKCDLTAGLPPAVA